MAEGKCDGLMTEIKEQGDLIRSLKLNSATKEQVTDALHGNMHVCKCYVYFTYGLTLHVKMMQHSGHASINQSNNQYLLAPQTNIK